MRICNVSFRYCYRHTFNTQGRWESQANSLIIFLFLFMTSTFAVYRYRMDSGGLSSDVFTTRNSYIYIYICVCHKTINDFPQLNYWYDLYGGNTLTFWIQRQLTWIDYITVYVVNNIWYFILYSVRCLRESKCYRNSGRQSKAKYDFRMKI